MNHEFTELHCAECDKLIGYVNLQSLGIDPHKVNYICRVTFNSDDFEVNCFCSEECAKVYGLEKSDD